MLSQERVGRITGSRAGAILGLSKWQSPSDILRQMVREWHGAPDEFTGNAATAYGHAYEPVALLALSQKIGHPIDECGFFVHPVHDWLGATPDGLVGLDAVVEIKCPYGLRDEQAPKFKMAEDLPHYYAQVQIEMACSGRKKCNFYQWSTHGDSLELVWLDGAWWDANFPKLAAFYAKFLSEIDNPAHLAPLRAQVDATELLTEYDQCSAKMAEAEARKREILGQLVGLCGGVDAEICGRNLTKVVRPGAVDYGKIPQLKGVDLEPYRKAGSEYWRLS